MMRMFLLNPDRMYQKKDAALMLVISPREAEKEMKLLKRAGLIRNKNAFKDLIKRGRIAKLKVSGFVLDRSFIYLKPLENLLINTLLIRNHDLLRRLLNVGNMRLIIVSGVFIQNIDSRVDLLLVGDKIRKGALQRVIRSLESNIGRELQYAVFDTTDFEYRRSVGDRLLRDVFDYKHQVLLDKLGITPEAES